MILIPFQINENEYNIFCALQIDNLERIQKYDPAQIQPHKLGKEWDALKLNTVLIGFANNRDLQRVQAWVAAGQPDEALKYLSRGFEFKPEQGDHDGMYGSVKS